MAQSTRDSEDEQHQHASDALIALARLLARQAAADIVAETTPPAESKTTE